MPIQITAKRNGHRRCGMRHSDKPVVYADDQFTDEELTILKTDPTLVVVEVSEETSNSTEGTSGTVVSDGAATKPEGEALTAAITAVIPDLNKDEDFTTSGSPKVKSVEKALGYDVTADEVAAAWELYTKDND